MDPVCREIQSNLQAYIDDELSASVLQKIERHLKNCPDCARVLAELQAASAILRLWETPGIKPIRIGEPGIKEARRKELPMIERKASPTIPLKRIPAYRKVLAAAAAIILLLGAALYISSALGPKFSYRERTVFVEEVISKATGASQIRSSAFLIARLQNNALAEKRLSARRIVAIQTARSIAETATEDEQSRHVKLILRANGELEGKMACAGGPSMQAGIFILPDKICLPGLKDVTLAAKLKSTKKADESISCRISFASALKHLKEGRPDKAMSECENAAALAKGRYFKGLCEKLLLQIDEAREILKEMPKASDNPDYYRKKASLEIRAGCTALALETLKDLQKKFPKEVNEKSRYLTAQLEKDCGDTKAALSSFKTLSRELKDEKLRLLCLFCAADIEVKKNNPAEAFTTFDSMLETSFVKADRELNAIILFRYAYAGRYGLKNPQKADVLVRKLTSGDLKNTAYGKITPEVFE